MDRTSYLFVDEAAYELPERFPTHAFKSPIRTLVDSEEFDQSPGALVPHHARHFVIFTTSPARSRYSRLHKTVRTCVIHINPWSRWEVHQA
jgi:hypothetical protein